MFATPPSCGKTDPSGVEKSAVLPEPLTEEAAPVLTRDMAHIEDVGDEALPNAKEDLWMEPRHKYAQIGPDAHQKLLALFLSGMEIHNRTKQLSSVI